MEFVEERRSSRVVRRKKILKRLHKRSNILERGRSSGGGEVSTAPLTCGRKKRGRGRGRRRRKKEGKTTERVGTNLREGSKGQGNGVGTSLGCNGMEVEDPGIETVPGMESWQNMGVPLPIIRALKDLGFTSPTEIQRRAIPVAMDTTRDVIGAAETGSGKTLAFSIPILSYIIANDSRGVARGGRSSNKTCGRGQGIVAAKQPEGVGSKFIDLNIVLHTDEEGEGEGEREEGEEEEGEEEEGEGEWKDVDVEKCEREEEEEDEQNKEVCSELDSVPYSEEEAVDDISDMDGDQIESETEGLMGASDKTPHHRTELVLSLDNIPEDEFLKMMSDDVTAGSHDPSDITVRSHDPSDVTDTSHDPSDVTKGSHDLGLLALILTPTRELALQIQSHIQAAAKYTGIQVCSLVGGMAGAKQERMLRSCPPIVVATPGRLWKLMSEGREYLTGLHTVRYLVLDEADRMIEFGHYQELSWILERVNHVKEVESWEWHRQTLVFSATLTLPRRSSEKKVKVRRRKNLSGQESVDKLISQVGLKDDSAIIDVARQSGTTETLSEMKIMCTSEEKDIYLYYFLLLYSGRTLVFVNSISTLQKLRSLLELLGLHPFPFHARMQQRQRLKNLDRFTASSNGLLLASDVAARGLDFPDVQHVIHYHVPRNSELYVHRSGRTARARREGLSVILIGPEDMTSYRNICKTLKRDGLPSFPMDIMYLQAVRKRISVAKRIETVLHRQRKQRRDADWLRSSVKTLELELDEDWYGTKTDPTVTDTGEMESIKELKAKLKSLLQIPIIPRSVSMTFPTRDQNHRILNGIKGGKVCGKCSEIVTMDTRDALTVAKTEISRHRPRHRR